MLRYEIDSIRNDLPPSNGLISCCVGDHILFSFDAPLARVEQGEAVTSPGLQIMSTPEGAELVLEDGAVDLEGAAPGSYRLKVKNGESSPHGVTLIVWPREALADPRVREPNRRVLPGVTIADPSPRSELAIRGILQRYVLEQMRAGKDLASFDALTANAPLPASVDWADYALEGRG